LSYLHISSLKIQLVKINYVKSLAIFFFHLSVIIIDIKITRASFLQNATCQNKLCKKSCNLFFHLSVIIIDIEITRASFLQNATSINYVKKILPFFPFF